ncbi:APH(3') family aminoglycoside O-phosphotransferase [Actinopolymorpha sp. B9G3]|uniref:APH(3') family aminoglycoside O-phosphotransferase n=1 Tax=Actinopolymorpha sp. B9G3 TaxID=3158970 RepID=UPI0032D9334C
MGELVQRVVRSLRTRFAGYEWTRVHHGFSGAATYELTGTTGPELYAKVAVVPQHLGSRSHLGVEAERIRWLSSTGIPGPELVAAGTETCLSTSPTTSPEAVEVGWLVMTSVPGREASAPWPVHQRVSVIDALADALRALHALPLEGCPFDRRLDVRLGQERAAVEAGVVDEASAAMEPWRWAQDRGALLAELLRTRPADEDLVVCHGDYCVPNVLLDPETLEVTGLIDLGWLGVADRYHDLGIATGSIASVELNPQYGPGHAARFLERYGGDPDDPRIDYYRRLDELT